MSSLLGVRAHALLTALFLFSLFVFNAGTHRSGKYLGCVCRLLFQFRIDRLFNHGSLRNVVLVDCNAAVGAAG